VRIVEFAASLHDVIERQPLDRRIWPFIDRRRVQGHVLIIGDVAPPFAFASDEFRIEAPRDHRIHYQVAAAVHVYSLRDREELSIAAGDPRPK
jgi:hypothetical protein